MKGEKKRKQKGRIVAEKNPRARVTLPAHARRELGVIFLFTLAVLSLLSLLGLAGTAGTWTATLLSIAFGEIKILVPFLLSALAAAMLKKPDLSMHWIQIIGIFFLILSSAAFFHLQFPPGESLPGSMAGKGGGLLGFFLSDALQNVVGFWGALFLLIAISLSSLLLVVNTSLAALWNGLRTGWLALRNRLFSLHSITVRMPGSSSESGTLLDSEADDAHLDHGDAADEPAFSRKERAAPTLSSERGQDSGASMEVLQPKKQQKKIQLSLTLLNGARQQPTSGDIKTNSLIIHKTLENFGIPVEMGEVNVGPTVTQFTLKPAEGIKLASITALHNDLALALAAHPIRIEAPIPGRPLVGIEVPNQKTALVSLREMLESEEFKKRKSNLTISLGKDVSGRPRLAALSAMPHLLIAGSTGSGKTVCINSLIMSLLFENGPDTLRFIMVDPKRVELPCYNDIPHLLTPVITDVKKALNALRWTIHEMERRFDLLARAGKRDLASYNNSSAEGLPYIVIIIDELADIMVTVGVEAESLIIRLAQMARAVGIHLVLATQRPSVDVITGLIKANITARIAFAVASQMDSRTILDMSGAEKLVGRGDMLYISAELSKPVRIQGAYVSDEEIDRVTRSLRESGEPSYHADVTEKQPLPSIDGALSTDDDGEDELLGPAKDAILQAGKASASLLQRRLRIGYARAARLLDLLEAQGFIGPGDGAKPREILSPTSGEYASDEDEDRIM